MQSTTLKALRFTGAVGVAGRAYWCANASVHKDRGRRGARVVEPGLEHGAKGLALHLRASASDAVQVVDMDDTGGEEDAIALGWAQLDRQCLDAGLHVAAVELDELGD